MGKVWITIREIYSHFLLSNREMDKIHYLVAWGKFRTSKIVFFCYLCLPVLHLLKGHHRDRNWWQISTRVTDQNKKQDCWYCQCRTSKVKLSYFNTPKEERNRHSMDATGRWLVTDCGFLLHGKGPWKGVFSLPLNPLGKNLLFILQGT